MNKVILMGRLTRDPEVRYSQSEQPVAVCRYSIAVNRRFKREGEPDADFINCVAFGKTGEFAERFFKKGMMVAIVGAIRTSSWDDQNGQKQYRTEVVVEEQEFGESKASFENRGRSEGGYNAGGSSGDYHAPQQNYQAQAPKASTPPAGFSAMEEDVDDDDLPF